MKLISALLIFLSLGTQMACSGQGDSKQKQTVATVSDTIIKPVDAGHLTLPGSFSSQTLLRFDSTELDQFMTAYPKLKAFQPRMQKFYSQRGFSFAWFDDKGLLEQAGNLHNKVMNIETEGLRSQPIYQAIFDTLMVQHTENPETGPADKTLELMLTAQYFWYAQQVYEGLGGAAMKSLDWDLPQKKISYTELLDSLLKVPGSRFMQNEPNYPQYKALKKYLAQYRSIEEKGGWSVVPADQKTYRLQDSGLAVQRIRTRLFLSGDLAEDNGSPLFDALLEKGVKKFQKRYGLTQDGIVGPQLMKEMNYPVEKRIEQIIVNMERCRWIPQGSGRDYIVVNVPEYRFHAYEADKPAWSMNVVVGTTMNKTAIFSGLMKTVVFSPYWNIPPGILKKETLPAIRRNKNYLARNHMEWNGGRVRQTPGPWNALGKVKFLFPNSHNIYLHDTPSKSAFEKDERSFSHGCIRVAEPKRLAMYVLRNQPEWTESRIDAAMNAGKEAYVTLKTPIPVFIAYFTAWVDADGDINFRKDIYSRDGRLAKMMMENSKL